MHPFSSVQLLSYVCLFTTPWNAASQDSLFITKFWSLLKLMSIKSVIPSNHLILCHPLLLPLQWFPAPGSFQMSQVFTSGSHSIWSFSFSISPSNEYSGLISFRMDWIHLLAVQGTLKGLPNATVQSTNSSALNFLYNPILTSIHDYWKNHSFD